MTCDGCHHEGHDEGVFFTKGKPIFVEGRLKLDQWESQTGEKRSRLLVELENWEFVGPKQDSYDEPPRQDFGRQPDAPQSQSAPPPSESPQPSAGEDSAGVAEEGDMEEDVPF